MDTTNQRTVEFSVDYCLADIVDACEGSYWWIKYRFVFAIAGVLLLGLGFATQSQSAMLSSVFLLGFGLAMIVRFQSSVKKTFASPSFAAGQQVCLTETGYSASSPALQSTVNWTQFVQFRETKGAFLLYPTPYTFLILPKRCFSHAQLPAAEELINSNVQKAKATTEKLAVFVFAAIMIGSFLIGFFTTVHN